MGSRIQGMGLGLPGRASWQGKREHAGIDPDGPEADCAEVSGGC